MVEVPRLLAMPMVPQAAVRPCGCRPRTPQQLALAEAVREAGALLPLATAQTEEPMVVVAAEAGKLWQTLGLAERVVRESSSSSIPPRAAARPRATF